MNEPLDPSLALLKEHLASADFQYGEDSVWWAQLDDIKLTWPHCRFRIRTPKQVTENGQLCLNMEFSGYPSQAPTGCPWDEDTGTRLPNDRWPKDNGIQNIKSIFNPKWESGVALYAPWDRAGLRVHPNWREKHKNTAWRPSSTITDYLRHTFRTLNPKRFL